MNLREKQQLSIKRTNEIRRIVSKDKYDFLVNCLKEKNIEITPINLIEESQGVLSSMTIYKYFKKENSVRTRDISGVFYYLLEEFNKTERNLTLTNLTRFSKERDIKISQSSIHKFLTKEKSKSFQQIYQEYQELFL